MPQRVPHGSYISIASALTGSTGPTLKGGSMFLLAVNDAERFLRPIILNNALALSDMRG
jgi:hypothetical protein